LLNPKGSHGQGAVFLLNFLKELEIQDIDAESAVVCTEVSIGELGRLDIVITDKDEKSIFIENKIYAIEQEDQLERYHKHNPTAHLLFLTLNGDEPAHWSTNPAYKTDQFNSVFNKVSYKNNILRWLESCRKDATTAPVIRESITQYIHLIQRLTQQNISERMNQELVKAILQDKESYHAYLNLYYANQAVRKQIIMDLNRKVREKTPEGVKLDEELTGGGEKYECYNFTTPELTANNLTFALEFENSGYRDCFFGFKYIDESKGTPVLGDLQQAFEKQFQNYQASKHWPAWKWWEPCNWDDRTFADLNFGPLDKTIISLVIQLKSVADNVLT